MQSKKLVRDTQLNAPDMDLEESFAFYEFSKEGLRDETANAMAKSTQSITIIDSAHVQLV